MIREANENDLQALLELYLHLHETEVPEASMRLAQTWQQILQDEKYHVIVEEIDGVPVSSCTCLIVPNLTRGVRPYAFVENVVTHADHRGKGYATACLDYAKALAQQADCYKIMLMTGSKDPATLNLYRKAGYTDTDKTAFVQWLGEAVKS